MLKNREQRVKNFEFTEKKKAAKKLFHIKQNQMPDALTTHSRCEAEEINVSEKSKEMTEVIERINYICSIYKREKAALIAEIKTQEAREHIGKAIRLADGRWLFYNEFPQKYSKKWEELYEKHLHRLIRFIRELSSPQNGGREPLIRNLTLINIFEEMKKIAGEDVVEDILKRGMNSLYYS